MPMRPLSRRLKVCAEIQPLDKQLDFADPPPPNNAAIVTSEIKLLRFSNAVKAFVMFRLDSHLRFCRKAKCAKGGEQLFCLFSWLRKFSLRLEVSRVDSTTANKQAIKAISSSVAASHSAS